MAIFFTTHIVAVACLVRNPEGKVLLVKNPVRGWEFPGGRVETGEDLITAVLREVEEESGIKAKVDNLVGIYSNTSMEKAWDGESVVPTRVIIDFVGEYVSGELRPSAESLEVGWFVPEEAEAMVSHEIYKGRIKQMLYFKGEILYRAYSKNPYNINVDRKI